VTPAMDRRSAARILDLAEPRGSRRLAVAAFAGLLAIAAHVAAGEGFPFVAPTAGSSPARAEHLVAEHAHMKRLMAVGAVAAMASSGVLAQDAVQWRVEDGGNGHWYLVDATPRNWASASAAAEAAGGYLATLTTGAESAFVWSFMHPRSPTGTAWLGAHAASGDCLNPLGYIWVTGETSAFTNWASGEPSGGFASADCALQFAVDPVQTNLWNDAPASWLQSSVVEWSADCNSDGIVDFGQIRAGELDDANGNNIPDCCENGTLCGCPGDANADGAVDGIDLAIVLTRWGQPGAKFPEADCNDDGAIDGVDLSLVLGTWGACP